MSNLNLETAEPGLHTRKIERLCDLILNFTNLIQDYGVHVKPFSRMALNKLKMLEKTQVDKIFNNFRSHYLVCAQAKRKKINLKDTRAFVNSALHQMGFKVPKEFFDTITSDDLVEIYDLSQRQIFRNLRFYEMTQYSLGDLLTFEWHELYYRPSSATEGIFASVKKIVEGSDAILPISVPSHLMKEIKADPVYISQVNFKYISPIFSEETGEKTGFILSCHGKNLINDVEESRVQFI